MSESAGARIAVGVTPGAAQATVGITAEPPKAIVSIHVTSDTDGLATKEYVDDRIDRIQISGGASFETDETISFKNGVLSVNTTDAMEQDNTLPITSAGVYEAVGNINALLKTI